MLRNIVECVGPEREYVGKLFRDWAFDVHIGDICLKFCVIDFVWVWTFYMESTTSITKIPLENELIYKIYLTQSN